MTDGSVPRLAIVTTHPIQYYAPVFRRLALDGRLLPRVYYTWSQAAQGAVYDPGFGKRFSWDVPLLDGYEYEFVTNTSRTPGRGFFGIRTPDLPSRISAWGATAVLVYGWNSASHLGVMRHFRSKIPVFFRGDSTLLARTSPMRRLLRRCTLRQVYRNVDVALAVGEHSRDYFAHAGLRPAQIIIAPHSVDNERFADADGSAQTRAEQWRAELGVPADAVVILFAGKLMASKAPDRLLDAFLKVGACAHLVIVGNGELESSLRQRSAGAHNVHYLPFQNQSVMPSVYRLADLFVLPAWGPETWGLALNEAMACGRAVAATDLVGGARDLIVPGVNGWIIPAGEAGALERMLRAAIDAGRTGLAAMGASASARIAGWSTAVSAARIADAVVGYDAK